MELWDQSKRSGNLKSRSTNAVSVAARTAIRSASGIRRKFGAVLALLALLPLTLSAFDTARTSRVDSALSFAEGRRADSLGLSGIALDAYSRALESDPYFQTSCPSQGRFPSRSQSAPRGLDHSPFAQP